MIAKGNAEIACIIHTHTPQHQIFNQTNIQPLGNPNNSFLCLFIYLLQLTAALGAVIQEFSTHKF